MALIFDFVRVGRKSLKTRDVTERILLTKLAQTTGQARALKYWRNLALKYSRNLALKYSRNLARTRLRISVIRDFKIKSIVHQTTDIYNTKQQCFALLLALMKIQANELRIESLAMIKLRAISKKLYFKTMLFNKLFINLKLSHSEVV